MTTAGSLAVRHYTQCCVDLTRQKGTARAIAGFVATRSLVLAPSDTGEDFVIFTTGVNSSKSEDALGQQYQSPASAISGGYDFIIVGRGILSADDRVQAAKEYQVEGWDAYEARVFK